MDILPQLEYTLRLVSTVVLFQLKERTGLILWFFISCREEEFDEYFEDMFL